jgi:hypothetical protein
MNHKHKIRILAAAAIFCAVAFSAYSAPAQEQNEEKKATAGVKGRDPFKQYEPVRKSKPVLAKLEPPSIQARIERYRAQKLAAAAAHVAPPKPTTALMLNEIQVNGIFRTPRGWAAMVEATPIKLSYVVYPGETFFDGQLVAIEESRLIFRRDTVWTDGHKDKSVEIKPLRQPSPVEAMTATKTAPTDAPAAPSSAAGGTGSLAGKPASIEKPASPEKPTSPEKQ